MKKKLAVLVMGLTLPLWGLVARGFLSVFPFPFLAFIVTYGIWAVLAFFAEDILENTVQALLLLNFPLLVALALFCANALAGPFLPDGLQRFLELSLLPVSYQYFSLFLPLTIPAPLSQVIGAALFLIASVIGCNARRYRWMGTGI